MKKSKKYLCVFVAVLMLMSGCKKDYTDGIEPVETQITTVKNPFKDVNGDLPISGESVVCYGVLLNKAADENLIYENGLLKVPLAIQNEGSDITVGIMIFANGILQEYYSQNSEKKSTMQNFNIAEKSVGSCELYIDNINSESTEKIDLCYLVIENPQINPTIQDFQSYFHGGTGGTPRNIILKSPINSGNFNIPKCGDTHIITDKEVERLYINIDINSEIETYCTTNFMLMPNDVNEADTGAFAVENGQTIVKLYGYSLNDVEAAYRVSLYKNHEKIKFNDGIDYIDIQTKNGYLSEETIKIDNLKSGDFIYAVAVPLDVYTSWVYKTSTSIILNKDEMPKVNGEASFKPSVPSEIIHDFDEGNDNEDDDIEFYTGEDYDDLPLSTDWIPMDQDEIESLKIR